MKAITFYRFEDTDPNWRVEIEHAFNRMRAFAPLAYLKGAFEYESFNRLINNNFERDDFNCLIHYSFVACSEATIKYNKYPDINSPIRDSVLQAAENLKDVMKRFDDWFLKQT